MSTKNVQYGVLNVDKFTSMMFGYTEGEPTMDIKNARFVSCQLFDQPQDDTGLYVSFEYDLDST